MMCSFRGDWIWWSLLGLSAASGVCMKPTFRGPSQSSSSGMVLETSFSYRHLRRLIAREDFIEGRWGLERRLSWHMSCHCPRIHLHRGRKTPKTKFRVGGKPAEIGTGYLLNTTYSLTPTPDYLDFWFVMVMASRWTDLPYQLPIRLSE
jgi:hypothetical protein